MSGKNQIPMAGLKAGFEELGFSEVKTYLNSGNVIFSSGREDCADFSGQIESMIKDKFALDIPVFLLAKEELEDILQHAPDWWGTENKDIYDNLIFIMPPITYEEVFREIGAPKEGLEQIANYQRAIFWSFRRKDYQKTNWWSKTATAKNSVFLTIRTANTVKKVVGM